MKRADERYEYWTKVSATAQRELTVLLEELSDAAAEALAVSEDGKAKITFAVSLGEANGGIEISATGKVPRSAYQRDTQPVRVDGTDDMFPGSDEARSEHDAVVMRAADKYLAACDPDIA